MKLHLALALASVACLSIGCATTEEGRGSATQSRKPSSSDRTTRVEIKTEAAELHAVDVLRKAWGDTFDPGDLKGPLNARRLARILLASPEEYSIKTPSILEEIRQAKSDEEKLAVASPTKATRLASMAPIRLAQSPAPVASEPGRAMNEAPASLKRLETLGHSKLQFTTSNDTPLIFDIPVTYNPRVSHWIRYFQTQGRSSFRRYLERSARYLPLISDELTRAGLPQDLVYVAMVESGFRADAVSHASAMGLWQFIAPTGRRYGLAVDWWIDERRDFHKSTRAAIAYMADLYEQFNSWYLVAASYNMGETRVRKLMARHNTNDFWSLADQGVLPRETTDYVPKIIAAMLISKAPALYGFRDLEYLMPLSFETTRVPGGTDLVNLAGFLGISEKYLQELNPELIKGFVPREVRGHTIRIPKGASTMVAQFIRERTRTAAN
ncbi:MAG: lytic transglycosylase domain-containing protein [Bdellovibrionota bacterium]